MNVDVRTYGIYEAFCISIMIKIKNEILNKLNGEELAVFCHILKRVDFENKTFLKRSDLVNDTGYSKSKVNKSIKGLVGKQVISFKQIKNNSGKFSSTIYKIL